MSSVANIKYIQSRLKPVEPRVQNEFAPYHRVFECERCGDEGALWLNVRGREEVIPCPDCEKSVKRIQRVRDTSYARSNVPPRYREYTFDSFESLPTDLKVGKFMAIEAMREFCHDDYHTVRMHHVVERLESVFSVLPPNITALKEKPDLARSGVVLQGVLGIGKTALAAAAMNEIISTGREVLMVRVFEALLSLKETWTDGDEIERLEKYKNAPVLILDELNLTSADRVAPSFQVDWVTSILRHREGNDLPTIITCNVDAEQFSTQWGTQCADVVLSLCHWIQMGGAKLRDTQQPMNEAF